MRFREKFFWLLEILRDYSSKKKSIDDYRKSGIFKEITEKTDTNTSKREKQRIRNPICYIDFKLCRRHMPMNSNVVHAELPEAIGKIIWLSLNGSCNVNRSSKHH